MREEIEERDQNRNPMHKYITIGVVSILIVVLLFLSFYTVKTGEVAIVKTFGKVTAVHSEGLHFRIPFVQRKEIITTREQTIRFGIDEEQSPISASTRDMQTVEIELTVSDTVDNPEALYRAFTGRHVQSLLVPRIRDAVQSNVAKYTIEEFVAKRAQLAKDIFEELKAELEPYGITLTNVSIVNHDFSDAYENAVEAKKVAEQEVETEKKKQEKLIVQQEAAIELAELEIEKKTLQAEANKIESESLSEEILRKYWIEKWDGKLPKVMTGSDSGIMLPPEILDIEVTPTDTVK